MLSGLQANHLVCKVPLDLHSALCILHSAFLKETMRLLALITALGLLSACSILAMDAATGEIGGAVERPGPGPAHSTGAFRDELTPRGIAEPPGKR